MWYQDRYIWCHVWFLCAGKHSLRRRQPGEKPQKSGNRAQTLVSFQVEVTLWAEMTHLLLLKPGQDCFLTYQLDQDSVLLVCREATVVLRVCCLLTEHKVQSRAILFLAWCMGASLPPLEQWNRVLSVLLNSHCISSLCFLVKVQSLQLFSGNIYTGPTHITAHIHVQPVLRGSFLILSAATQCLAAVSAATPPPTPRASSPTETRPYLGVHSPQCVLLVQGGKEG